jgi:DNA-binding NtrC family response regulator
MRTLGTALVVDRSFQIADAVADALEKYGYHALSEILFEGASKELAADPTPSLVIMHGGALNDQVALDFLSTVSAAIPRIPLVIITGMELEDLVVPPGLWAYVQKPFDITSLMRGVDRAIASVAFHETALLASEAGDTILQQ